MNQIKKNYKKPVMEVFDLEMDNVILTSAGKNPALCTSKNPGLCNLGFNPGHGCSNYSNPGNDSYGGIYKNKKHC